MPTALVTGATGLVGSHIVERLAASGWRIRALLRGASPVRHGAAADGWNGPAWLREQGVELVAGDILDLPAFTGAARGCDVIFHTAAAVTPPTSRVHPYDAYRIPNVNGTRNAIGAAERTGARLLQLSSVAVYGPESRYALGSARVDETTPLEPMPEHAYYSRSKRESEELVMEAHGAGRIWATAVRPDVIYGRRDRQFVPRVARLARLGAIPLIGGGLTTFAIVHAANVADGAVRAATTDRAGGAAYNLANDFDVTVRDFFRLAGEGLDRPMHFVSVPIGVARVGFKIVKRALRIATGGRLSVVSTASIDFVSKNNPFSSERARRELGWKPSVRPETGIPEAFRWWKEHHA